jgi:hypothetical protein
MMKRFSVFKRILRSFSFFLAAFIVISLAADASFLQRKTTSLRGEAGWQGMPDFRVFWRSGRVMSGLITGENADRAGGAPLYDKEEPFYHFRYSPAAAIAMVPFGRIPYPRRAMLLWMLMGNLAFLSALLVLSRHINKRLFPDSSRRALVLWIMLLGTLRYYFVVICQGQTDGLVAFLLVLLLVAYVDGRQIFSGVLLAAILQIKPFFAPLVFLFLVDRRYKAFLSVFAAMLAFAVLPALFIGIKDTVGLTKDWIYMVRVSGFSQVLNYKNQSLPYGLVMAAKAVLLKARGIDLRAVVVLLSGVFTVFAAGGFFLFARRLKRADNGFYRYLSISVITAILVIFSPLSWEAYYMFLIIPLALFTGMAITTGNWRKMCFYLSGYFLMTLSVGTDISKIIPVLEDFRFVNISLATVFLFFGVFDLYLRLPEAPSIQGSAGMPRRFPFVSGYGVCQEKNKKPPKKN